MARDSQVPTFNLAAYQRRHNMLSLAKGIMWLPTAAIAWCLSYWLMWWIVAVLCYQFGSIWNWLPSAAMLGNAAWIGIAILAFEGMRFGKRLLDRETYAKSAYYDLYEATGSRRFVMGRYLGNPIGAAWLISEFLLFAPRATVRALQAFKSHVHLPSDVIDHAEAIVEDLAGTKEWTSPLVYGEHKRALYPLHKLGVIWEDVRDDQLLIKLHPNFVDNWLTRGG